MTMRPAFRPGTAADFDGLTGWAICAANGSITYLEGISQKGAFHTGNRYIGTQWVRGYIRNGRSYTVLV